MRNRDFTDKLQVAGIILSGLRDGWDQLRSAELKGSNKVALRKFIKVGWVEFSQFNGFDVKDGNQVRLQHDF